MSSSLTGLSASEIEGGDVVVAETVCGICPSISNGAGEVALQLCGGGGQCPHTTCWLCRGSDPLRLGDGEQVFESAKAALQRWEQFRLGWVEAWSPETPIQPGEVVAVMGRAMGIWWLNAARIVYVVDESGPITKFGFAYGTLPGHVESGEERFLIEWDRKSKSVWYDILAFSRPNHILIRLGYPVVRRLQKRFGRDSAAAMLRAVGTSVSRKVK